VSLSFASNPFGLSLSKSLLDSGAALASASEAALSPRRATYFSLLRQRNLRKRKATLVSASPALRYGATCGARSSRGLVQTRLRLKQARALIRLALRSSAHSQGLCVPRSDSGSGSCPADTTIFIAARARITWARGQKHLRNRRAAWFLGSDPNFAAQHPQGKPKARRIWALTPKTPDPAPAPASDPIPTAVWQGRAAQRQADQGSCLSEPQASLHETPPDVSSAGNPQGPDFGSPFFALGFFGEAKRGKSPAAATERLRNAATPSTPEATQVQQ
jgi:hypothetical protein